MITRIRKGLSPEVKFQQQRLLQSEGKEPECEVKWCEEEEEGEAEGEEREGGRSERSKSNGSTTVVLETLETLLHPLFLSARGHNPITPSRE